MLSGKPPFQGSAAELMDQHQRAALPIEKLRNVPGPVIALLNVLLAKDPSQRFQNPAIIAEGDNQGSEKRLVPGYDCPRRSCDRLASSDARTPQKGSSESKSFVGC